MIKTFDKSRALTFVKFEVSEQEEYERYCDDLTNRKHYPYKVVEELIDGNDIILTFANDVGSVIKVRTEVQKDIKVAENGLNEELEAFEEVCMDGDEIEQDTSGLLTEE